VVTFSSRRTIVCAVLATSSAIAGASCLDFDALSGSDAGSDSGFDSSAGVDASSDVGVISDGGSLDGDSGSFCQQNSGHTFCDDFDDPAYLTPWNQPRDLTNDASLSQDPTTFVSAPYSLNTAILSADAGSVAYVVTKFGKIPSSLRLEFDFSLASGGSSTVTIANVNLPKGVSFTFKLVEPTPPLFEVVEVTRNDGGAEVYSVLPNIAYPVGQGQWYHVVATMDLLGADAGEVDVSFNHGPVIVNQVAVPISFDAGSTFQLQTGVGSFSPAPYNSASVNLDNYLVDLN
jgi:hypothetical protein